MIKPAPLNYENNVGRLRKKKPTGFGEVFLNPIKDKF